MDPNEERKKKLEAGKEKLAAFRKKKAKRKKPETTQNANPLESNNEAYQQQGGEGLSPPEMLSPNEIWSITDSDQFSFTSGDEWSAEETDQNSSEYYQAKLAEAKRRITELEETGEGKQLALDTVISQFEAAQRNDPHSEQGDFIKWKEGNSQNGDVESALAYRDNLISQLMRSLQSSKEQNIPSDDVMTKIHALAQHISILHSQLLQADQTLQEQLILHESSSMALQAAKAQMLQLQFIVNHKDQELRNATQKVQEYAQTVHYLQQQIPQMKNSTEKNETIMLGQYEDRIKVLEEELKTKFADSENWTQKKQQWASREEELLSSLDMKSSEVSALLQSQETLQAEKNELGRTCEMLQAQLRQYESDTSEEEKVKYLEFQLEELRRAHESDTNEIVMLKRRNVELEEASDHAKCLSSSYESLRSEYDALVSKHSEELSQLEQLKSVNSDLQENLQSHIAAAEELAALKVEMENLTIIYHEEVKKRAEADEMFSDIEAKFSEDKDLLNNRINGLQNELTAVEANLSTSSDARDRETNIVMLLQSELKERKDELKMKADELSQMLSAFETLQSDYSSLETNLKCSEELVVDLTQKLQAAEQTLQEQSLPENEAQNSSDEHLRLQQKVQELQTILEEREFECRKYADKVAECQDEILSNQNVHGIEMSEKEYHAERMEEQIYVMNSEAKKYVQRIEELHSQLSLEKQEKEKIIDIKMNLESRLNELLSERETLLHSVDSGTAVVRSLKNDLQKKSSRQSCVEANEVTITGGEHVINAKLQAVENTEVAKTLTLQASENKGNSQELCTETDDWKTNVHEVSQELESHQSLNIQYQNEIEDLKATLKETKGELREVRESLQLAENELINSRGKHSEQCEILNKRIEDLEKETSETAQLQAEVSELKGVKQQLSEQELAQEALQTQLESTVSQWQRLQLIVQEKEIEVQTLQEDLEEQKRICSTLKKNENEERELLQSENDSLKTVMSKQNEELERELLELKDNLERKITELSVTKTTLYEREMELDTMKEDFTLKESEMSNLKHMLMERKSETAKLQAALLAKEEEATVHKNNSDEKETLVANLEDKLEAVSSEGEILKTRILEIESLTLERERKLEESQLEKVNLATALSEKESGLENLGRQLAETYSEVENLKTSQSTLSDLENTVREQILEITNLKTTLVDRESQIERLEKEVIDKVSQIEIYQKDAGEKDREILTNKSNIEKSQSTSLELEKDLNDRTLELMELRNLCVNKEKENDAQQNNLTEKQFEIDGLKNSVREKEDEVYALKLSLKEKETKIDGLVRNTKELESINAQLSSNLEEKESLLGALQKELGMKDTEIVELKKDLTDKESKIVELENTLLDKQSDISRKHSEISELKTNITDSESEITDLKSCLTDKESEIVRLKNSLINEESSIVELKTSITEKESEIVELKNCLAGNESVTIQLKNSVEGKDTEIVELQRSSTAKESEIAVLKEFLTVKESEVEESKRHSASKDSEILEKMKKLEEKEVETCRLGEDLTNKERRIEALEHSISQGVSHIESLTMSLEEKNSQIENWRKISTERDDKIAMLKKILEEKERDISSLEEKLVSRELKIDSCKNLIAESDNAEIRRMDFDKENGELKNSLLEKEAEIVSFRKILSEKDGAINELKAGIREQDMTMQDLQSRISEKNAEVDGLKSRAEEIELEMVAFKDSLSDKGVENSDLKDRLEKMEVKAIELESMLESKEREVAVFKNMVEEKEAELIDFRSFATNVESTCEGLKMELEGKESKITSLTISLTEMESEATALRSRLARKETEFLEKMTELENNIGELSSTIESSKMSEEILRVKHSESLLEKEILSQSLAEMKVLVAENETQVSELMQKSADGETLSAEMLQKLRDSERTNDSLKAMLSSLISEMQAKDSELVNQKLLIEDQKLMIEDQIVKITTLSDSSQEIKALNVALQDQNETLKAESIDFIGDTAQQRKAIEQQVAEMEQLLTQKQQHMSAVIEELAQEKTAAQHLSEALKRLKANHYSLQGLLSCVTADINAKDGTLIEQQLEIDNQSVKIRELCATADQTNVSLKEIHDLNIVLKEESEKLTSQCMSLEEERKTLDQKLSKLQSDLGHQECLTTQYTIENKELSEKLMQMTETVESQKATIFDLKRECEIQMQDIGTLKHELAQKDISNTSLKHENESVTSSLTKSKEEKEMLKSNFDACMEDMQQRLGDQEMEVKRLRCQLAEETKNVHQDQDQLKEIFEHQMSQMDEKLLHSEKHCELLEKELTESKAKSAAAKEMYEHQLGEVELNLQSSNSELVKMKENLAKIINDHECKVGGMKRLHDIQTSELEDNCVALERTVAEQKKNISELTAKFRKEKNDLEHSIEIQVSEADEKRRFAEMESSRLKRHLEEMKHDHERDLQNLEKSYEARLYELEDKCCVTTNELERLRKSLMNVEGGFSEERLNLEMRTQELETIRRDLEIKTSIQEDEIALMKEQAHQREEEMKSVLKDAALKQQEKTYETNQLISHLREQVSELTKQQKQMTSKLKEEYEAQLTDLQSKNKQLELKSSSLEMHIEQDLQLSKGVSDSSRNYKDFLAKVTNMQTQIKTLSEENYGLKRKLLAQKTPERTLRLNSGVEAICPPYPQSFSSSDVSQTGGGDNGDCFSPTEEEDPMVEGFFTEDSLKAKSPLTVSQHGRSSDRELNQEPDFVEEQRDGFQPEIVHERVIDSSGQLNIHPIREKEICEGFQPETTDLFLMETIEEPGQAMIWPDDLSVGMSPSLKQQGQQFEFNIPGKFHGSTEKKNSRSGLTKAVNVNSNCNAGDSACSQESENSEEAVFEQRLNNIKEELEEEYVTKMRRQEVVLTHQFESQKEEYKQEMEHHFAQRVKATRYEWERKFTKALQKVKKEMERRHLKELGAVRQSLASKLAKGSGHQESVDAALGEPDPMPDIAENKELGEVVEKLHKENQELAEVRDVLLQQIEFSQARGLHTRVQHELQTMMTDRVSVSSHSSETTTPTQLAGSPTMEAEENTEHSGHQQQESGVDDADSARSEISETNSARERFLEELEEISHQSSQDLPLEWELTTTLREAGDFEQEPEHHSVWEVFDGRCVRQDCQEVRHRFHKLYQWVISKGDGFDIALDEEFKLLSRDEKDCLHSENGHFKVGSLSSWKENYIDLSDNDSMNSSRERADSELLDKMIMLETEKQKLEEKLSAQMDMLIKEKSKMEHHIQTLNAQLLSETLANKDLRDELHKNYDMLEACNFESKNKLGKDTNSSEGCSTEKMTGNNSLSLSSDLMEETWKQKSLSRPSSDMTEATSSTERDQMAGNKEHRSVEQSLKQVIHHLQLMFLEKEEMNKKLRLEIESLRSNVQKQVGGSESLECDLTKLSLLEEQLQTHKELLGLKEKVIKDLQADLNRLIYPKQTSFDSVGKAIQKTSEDGFCSAKQFSFEVSGVRMNSESQDFDKNVDDSEDNTCSPIQGTASQTVATHTKSRFSPLSVLPLSVSVESAAQSSSVISSSESSILQLDEIDSIRSGYNTPLELQDSELAGELSQLRKDLKETKAIYSKENTLLQEALHKEIMKDLVISRTGSGDAIGTVESNRGIRESSKSSDALDEAEILKQRLAICLEQNHILEHENSTLRTRIRELEALIIQFRNKLQKKEKDTAEWYKSFNVQLSALQKQRNDLLKLIRDMESGKEATMSGSLQGAMKEESLRNVQEDLMEKMEELDHLHKMLTQRQIELQHCEAERRHLEQLCLLKDLTEIQLMKQKRLIEEQVSEIELRLRERETTLVEEKTRLLQELKEKDLFLSKISNPLQSSDPILQVPRSSSLGDLSLGALEEPNLTRRHSTSQTSNLVDPGDADRQHLEAIEKLRSKLKLEYEIRAARMAESQSSAIASYWERHNKQV